MADIRLGMSTFRAKKGIVALTVELVSWVHLDLVDSLVRKEIQPLDNQVLKGQEARRVNGELWDFLDKEVRKFEIILLFIHRVVHDSGDLLELSERFCVPCSGNQVLLELLIA